VQVSGEADMTASTDMVTYEHLIQLREIQHARAPAAHESNATYPPQPPGQVTPVSMAADTLVGQPYLSLLQTPVNLSAPLDYFVSRADVPAIVNQVIFLDEDRQSARRTLERVTGSGQLTWGVREHLRR
jgi:hypothetical protein